MSKNGKKSSNANDQRSNVKNPNNEAFKQNLDNHANQNNPNNEVFWLSRGFSERPADWLDKLAQIDKK